MVTKQISEVDFLRPVKTGRIVKIYGSIASIGITSLKLNLEARKHNPITGKQKPVCTTTMVFVQIDEEGEPMPLSQKVKDKWQNCPTLLI